MPWPLWPWRRWTHDPENRDSLRDWRGTGRSGIDHPEGFEGAGAGPPYLCFLLHQELLQPGPEYRALPSQRRGDRASPLPHDPGAPGPGGSLGEKRPTGFGSPGHGSGRGVCHPGGPPHLLHFRLSPENLEALAPGGTGDYHSRHHLLQRRGRADPNSFDRRGGILLSGVRGPGRGPAPGSGGQDRQYRHAEDLPQLRGDLPGPGGTGPPGPGRLYQPLRPGRGDGGGKPPGSQGAACALSLHDYYQKEGQRVLKAAAKTSGGLGKWALRLIFGLLLMSYWLGLWPGAHHLTARKLYHQLASPLLRLLVYLGLGLLVGQAIESLGWAVKLGSWAAPLLRWGHLRRECGAAFTAAFFSGILANTMLVTLYQEGKISRREMTVTYLFNNAMPVYLLHLPTTFFIIFPLTRQAGLIYLGLTLAAALLRSVVLLFYGRLRLPAEHAGEGAITVPAPERQEGLLQEIWGKFQRRFIRGIFYTFPIYIFIFLLNY